MNDFEQAASLVQWKNLQEQGQSERLLEALQEAPIVELVEFFTPQEPKGMLKLLTSLSLKIQSQVFAEMPEDLQLSIYNMLSKKDFTPIFIQMPSDQRADFYQRLSDRQQVRLLPYLPKRVREDVITLSSYPEETAGGIMSTDFATLLVDMTIREAFAKLREDAPSKKMIYYSYVVDDGMILKGFVTIKDLIMADESATVSSILHENFVYARVEEKPISVARTIEKYDLVALPILNDENQLVGIVSYADAMVILREEQTEDMEKFMGIVTLDEESDYLRTSSLQHFKKRVTWLVGLFVASSLSSVIMHRYEALLERLTVLALYLPMITSTGGNAGSQSASMVIRALSLGEITLADWVRIILKELRISLMLALCLFVLTFIKVVSLSGHAHAVGANLMVMATAISTALGLQVITSTVIGASLPLVAKYFNGDPAVAASPAITTLVDITGMGMYFAVVTCML